MKRIKQIYHRIWDIDNLHLADSKARKGKKKSYGVQVHDKRKDDNLLDLSKSLREKTFRTSAYDVFFQRS